MQHEARPACSRHSSYIHESAAHVTAECKLPSIPNNARCTSSWRLPGQGVIHTTEKSRLRAKMHVAYVTNKLLVCYGWWAPGVGTQVLLACVVRLLVGLYIDENNSTLSLLRSVLRSYDYLFDPLVRLGCKTLIIP